jgi:hypothetical protein
VYFVDYAAHLPDGNVPFGREIAAAIDALPEDAEIHLLGCCWGAWGQPEPGGITYALRRPRPIAYRPDGGFDCPILRSAPRAVVFLDPRASDRIAAVEGCLRTRATVKRIADVNVFAAIDSRQP